MCRLARRVVAVVLLFASADVVATRGTRDGSNVLTGGVHPYTVKAGDSLTSISARHGAAVATLVEDNQVKSTSRLVPGQQLTVDNRHIIPPTLSDGITINIPQRMLFVTENGRLVRAFPVAVGRSDWPSPVGEFTIEVKEIDPTWDVPQSIQQEQQREGKPVLTKVPAGPANPLGDRWLGLSGFAVGIHGTNAPASVFGFTTHGCFRLHPDDARTVFDLVEVGTPVHLVYRPVLAAVDEEGRLWLEVNRDVYRRGGNLERLAGNMMEEAVSLSGRTLNDGALRQCVREARGRPCLVS